MNQVATVEVSPLSKFDEGMLKGIESKDGDGGASRALFQPRNMGEAMEVAKIMSAGNFIPPHLRNKPGDCLAVVMQSARWGMDPFAVGNKTYFVNDRIAYESQLVNAVINAAHALDGRLDIEWSGEGNNLECTVTGFVKGDPKPKTRAVKISTITTRSSQLWKQDPEQQIAYYATRAWVRLHAPEVLMGVYTPDEIKSVPDTVAEAIAAEEIPLTSDMLIEQSQVEPQDAEVEAEVVEQADTPADEASDDTPPYAAAVANIKSMIDAATDDKALKAADTELEKHYAALPDEVANELDDFMNAKRTALKTT